MHCWRMGPERRAHLRLAIWEPKRCMSNIPTLRVPRILMNGQVKNMDCSFRAKDKGES